MPVEIVELIPSQVDNKRFKIVVAIDGHDYTFHFGQQGGNTYIDQGDEVKRHNYRARHYANKAEKNRIDNLIPSPALFSWKLLWGDKPDLMDNLVELQREFNSKYK